MRCFIDLSYVGTEYHGWQRQPESISVQEVMEATLSELLGAPTIVVGCGRTDTGVHASSFYAHFEWEGPFGTRFKDWDQAAWKLNGMLPADIGVRRIFEVGPRDHARFDATERGYTYHVHTHKDPFLEDRSARVYQTLDLEAMNAGVQHLIYKGDFAAFCKTGSGQKTTICDLRSAQWTQTDPHRYRFDIAADRFLRNMVRAIVGTLLDVGRGRLAPEDVKGIAASCDRSNAGMSASACGLYLSRVEYPFLNS
ncbi:tRNA pseudouridine(38-40) synthase TruA [Flavobacteriales bacterium]|nr:tRNA pseudouridine(38-40) synthase TruA [Flavobacteriales bacterium]